MSGQSEGDRRFTAGLLYDVHQVLKAHGYQAPAEGVERSRAFSACLSALFSLVLAFEGKEFGQ